MDKKVKTKEKNNKDNYKILFIAIIAVLVFVIIDVVALKGCSKKDDKNNEEEEVIEKIGAKEEDLISAYGMSKEDAINIVKEIYNSDNYEFSADINEDSKYIVSVKNTISNKVDKFIVDPTSEGKSFYMINE